MEARYRMYQMLVKEVVHLHELPSNKQFIQHIIKNFESYGQSIRVAFDSDMSVEECIDDLIYKARLAVK